MKFKCNLSGCVYNFESELDIKAMQASLDYTQVTDVLTTVGPDLTAPPVLTTMAPARPVAKAPDKPLPTPPAAFKAV